VKVNPVVCYIIARTDAVSLNKPTLLGDTNENHANNSGGTNTRDHPTVSVIFLRGAACQPDVRGLDKEEVVGQVLIGLADDKNLLFLKS
jgi:hypothetical protein